MEGEKTQPDTSRERLLETENGMLLLELEDTALKDLEEYLSISPVAEDKKEKCREAIKASLNDLAHPERYAPRTPYDYMYTLKSQLFNILNGQDSEEKALFVSLRDRLDVARDSVMGWKKK